MICKCGLDLEKSKSGVILAGYVGACDLCGATHNLEKLGCFYIEDYHNPQPMHHFWLFDEYVFICHGCGRQTRGVNTFCEGLNVTNEIKALEEAKI